ncbi:cyclic pyranopterin monophosphate synthase MoaC [Terricaulis sp.]|uniref:cyclic pyranopterin monophosphate synthase MoaC n=1 Tax=Terricaulis sp. TaxID=2768686 RepID=UPI003785242A
MNQRLTHLDDAGRARMVDVADKPVTAREAMASGRVRMAPETFARVLEAGSPKGDVRAVAEIAGVMAGKRTADLIPLCHPLPLSSLKVEVATDTASHAFVVTARAKTVGQTGVEMEALTAVSVACLAIYDMLKAIDRNMVIDNIALMTKSGGASGDYKRGEP